MSQDYENLQLEEGEGGVFTLTIDRPKVLNALDDQTFRELDRAVDEIAANDAVRAVIVTGAGDKAFVAGADIQELADQDSMEGQARSRRGQRVFDKLEALPKPVIAAVNGFALGGGCELALACHLRFASSKARLGLPEATLGIIPGYGGTQRLSRLVGVGNALQCILTADMVNAEEAHRIGLVNGIFEPEELIPSVREIAGKIISRGPIAIRFALEAVLRGRDTSMAEGLSLESISSGSSPRPRT